MREILFRGKRLGESQWIEGSLKQTGGICEIHTFDNEAYAKEAENGWDIFDYTNDVTVDPETVCQFTGLTDKNGVKIWEGDIMGGGHLGFAAAVTFNDGMFQLVTSAHQGNSPLVQDRASRIKVIGNIFDNPELLQ